MIKRKQKSKSIEKIWDVGEKSAQKKLNDFIKKKLSGYSTYRDYPAKNKVSRLSPHLHFGEISPAQVLESVINVGFSYAKKADVQSFLTEIAWREFSGYLLYHFNVLHKKNFKSKFDDFPWINNDFFLKAWQNGQTGYPFVDAGMRELLETGCMHNRVRMVVASFLIKNLNIHWHKGRNWFWNYLVDADLASNSASWQWVAGSGVDAAPYFRIFNPVTQGEKFDKDGDYTKKYIPELNKLPAKYLFKPWMAPEKILKTAGVRLGKNYPMPIIDLKISRNKALKAYKKL